MIVDVDKTQTGAVSESTFPDTGETPPSIDYATQEGRNKRQLVDPSTCPFKKRFKSQTGTFNNNTNDHKGDYLSAEHCPFKKRFQSQPGTGTSESNCDDSVGDQFLPSIHIGDRHNNVDTRTNSDSTWSGRLQSQPGTGTSESNCDDSVGDHSLPNIHTGDRHKNVDNSH